MWGMIHNPNTSGIFETNFITIADEVHKAGGLVYMDGANMNAIAGIVNLDTLGVDAVHNNLHKTWTIPHGGGGPETRSLQSLTSWSTFFPACKSYRKRTATSRPLPLPSVLVISTATLVTLDIRLGPTPIYSDLG